MPNETRNSGAPRQNSAKASQPSRDELWRAIDVYLREAYGQSPPSAVQQRLETLRLSGDDPFEAGVFERHPPHADPPAQLKLRLGNRFYPHMKLTIDRRPDQKGYLFRADTHDRHCCPAPGTADFRGFQQLMQRNEELARQIEQAWADAGIPTFKSWLKDDLARRQQP